VAKISDDLQKNRYRKQKVKLPHKNSKIESTSSGSIAVFSQQEIAGNKMKIQKNSISVFNNQSLYLGVQP